MDSTDNTFEKLRSLLLEPHVSEVRQRHEGIDQHLAQLEAQLAQVNQQLATPEALLELLAPIMLDLLKVSAADSQAAFAAILAELIDLVLTVKIQQDRDGLVTALAPVIPASLVHNSAAAPEAMGQAIALNLSSALKTYVEQERGALAQLIAPEIGAALKAQIRLERDAVVDALYPVIGNTISRYFAELLQDINAKLEQTLSFETLTRKIRARVQGISEAELLLRSATPVRIHAIFLIHKPSGLVIAEAQPIDATPLESELIAGMLTAIRSFVSEYVSQPEQVSELREIEYGDAQIWLEEAGYCYLAMVIQGSPTKVFLRGVQGVLAQLVEEHGDAIQAFEGDLDTIPDAILLRLQQIIQDARRVPEGKSAAESRSPRLLLAIAGTVSALILGLLGYGGYRSFQNARFVDTLNASLRQDPALAIYRLTVMGDRQNLRLTGYVPAQPLAERAANKIAAQAPAATLENQIIAIEAPQTTISLLPKTNSDELAVNVQRTAKLLNQIPGIYLQVESQAGNVQIESFVRSQKQAAMIEQAFNEIPGIQTVTHNYQIRFR